MKDKLTIKDRVIKQITDTEGKCIVCQDRPHGRTSYFCVEPDSTLRWLDIILLKEMQEYIDRPAQDGNGILAPDAELLCKFFAKYSIEHSCIYHVQRIAK